MANLLEGKCAVITGSGRGQGREIALEMAKRGVKVVVNDLGGAVDGSGADRAPVSAARGQPPSGKQTKRTGIR